MTVDPLERERAAAGRERETLVRSGLQLESLSLRSWRNYDSFRLDGIGGLTIIVGPNAVGKTSIVEAVQMVTALKSFRTSKFGQMVQWGKDRAAVGAKLTGNGRDLDLHLSVENGKRSYQLNGKGKRVADLKGLMPAVTFCPDDLNLVKGTHSARRDAIDSLGGQLSKNFYAVRSDYTKLVRQKNRALKEELPDAYIDSIDDLLVRVGVQLIAHRMVITSKMRDPFRRFYEEITAGRESLDMMYLPSWSLLSYRAEDDVSRETAGQFALDEESFDRNAAMENLSTAIAENRMEERARKRAVYGPQSDRIDFLLDGRNAIHYSSQGQQRSIVLAFKLAEAAVISDTLDQKPILLLDDVMSELDEDRRHYFMDFISDDIQTIITTTNEDYFDASTKAKADVVRLEPEDSR